MLNPPKIYFAGKVKPNGWRQEIFGPLVMSEVNKTYKFQENFLDYSIIYNGPYALRCDHGCFHGSAHGLTEAQSSCTGFLFYETPNISLGSSSIDCKVFEEGSEGLPPHEAVEFCFTQIRSSDAIVAYIESLDCYGTIVELGYAASLNIPVYLYIKSDLLEGLSFSNKGINYNLYKYENYDDLWFIKNLPNIKNITIGKPTVKNFPEDLRLY